MVKLTRIYTRGGDKGETSLGDGSRVGLDGAIRPPPWHRMGCYRSEERTRGKLKRLRMQILNCAAIRVGTGSALPSTPGIGLIGT